MLFSRTIFVNSPPIISICLFVLVFAFIAFNASGRVSSSVCVCGARRAVSGTECRRSGAAKFQREVKQLQYIQVLDKLSLFFVVHFISLFSWYVLEASVAGSCRGAPLCVFVCVCGCKIAALAFWCHSNTHPHTQKCKNKRINQLRCARGSGTAEQAEREREQEADQSEIL